MTEGASDALRDRIDVIEEAYEYLLAYAAQGREDDSGPDANAREFLTQALAAFGGLADAAAKEVPALRGGPDPAWADYVEMLRQDAARAAVTVRLVLAQPRISSSLIDNFNASSHVRTLLTDLFLMDEALKASSTS